MSLAVTIGKGVAWTSASSVVIRLAGLIYLFVILRTLSVYEYGVVELVLSIPPLLSFFALPGLETTLIADMGVEREKGDRGRMRYLFESFLSVRLLLAAVAWALVFFSAPFVAAFYNAHIGNMVRVVSFVFLSGALRTLYLVLFRVGLKFKVIALYSALEEVLKLTLLLLLLQLTPVPPLAAVGAYVGAEWIALLALAPWAAQVRRELFAGARGTRGFRAVLHLLRAHGKWSVFSTYMGSFHNSIRLWLIKFFVSTEAVAVFAVAQGLLQQTAALFPLNRVLMPIIPQYVARKDIFLKLVDKAIKYQLIGYAALGAGAAIFFPPILGMIFPQYENSFSLFRIMLLALLPGAVGGVFGAAFFALKRQKDLFGALVKNAVFSIVLSLVLLPLWGVVGAAVELILARTFYAWERYRVLKRVYPGFSPTLRDFLSFDAFDLMLLKRVREKLFPKAR